MVKKILITIVVLILIVVIGFICKDIIISSTYADDNERFVQITPKKYIVGDTFIIFYDKETKVEYGFYARGGFKALIDAEGNPLLYKEGE